MATRLFLDGYPVVAGRGATAVAVSPLPEGMPVADDDFITDLFARGQVEWLAIGDDQGLIARFDHEDLTRDPSLAESVAVMLRQAHTRAGLAELRRWSDAQGPRRL